MQKGLAGHVPIITFRSQENSDDGVLRFPLDVDVRDDAVWDR